MAELTGGLVLGVASGAVLVVLAGLVLRPRPRPRVNVAFAVFAGGLGVALALRAWGGGADQVSASPQGWDAAVAAVVLVAAVVSSLALVAVALRVPRRLPRGDRWMLVPAAALALAVAALRSVLHIGLVPAPAATSSLVSIILPAWTFALLLWALRFPREPRPGQVAVVSVALLAWVGAIAGFTLGGFRGGAHPAVLASAGALLVVAGVWLAQMLRARTGAAIRAARAAALAALAFMAIGFAAYAFFGNAGAAVTAGVVGALNVVSGALLAYAILRHQLLGLDLKVKWTVRQSTVAAAFIGVFFVVSESASTFFSSTGLGPYLGIGAAGLLVFAMAPLQRAAERVASVALPDARAPGELSRDERARVYAEAVRGAWSDGALSRDEREMLDRLAGSLGLGDADARRVEREAIRGAG